jgi:2-aminoadipate transaminase
MEECEMDGSWKDLISEGARNVKTSPIREMVKLIRQPGMISFAGGMPDPAIFPIDEFYDCAEILKEKGTEVLQYGATDGYAPLKEFLAGWTSPRMGREISTDEILITAGSIQVVDLLNQVMIDRGDSIIIEEPTFMGTTANMHNPAMGMEWKWINSRPSSKKPGLREKG